jgi:SAM-dependent methyltransferase
VDSGEVTRECYACGSADVVPLLEDLHYPIGENNGTWRYTFLECRKCGLGFIDPLPPGELLVELYDEDYGPYDERHAPSVEEAYSAKYKLARMSLAGSLEPARFAPLQRALTLGGELLTGKTVSYTLAVPLQLPNEAAILELGYGSGNWLLSMAELNYHNLYGYDIEASPVSSERLQRRGIHVSQGPFSDLDYPARHFDCVRMEHVFEHLPNPVEVLLRCRMFLKSSGHLVMNFPCRGGWSERISLVDHPSLDLPRHIFRHTLSSVTWMLDKAGFTIQSAKVYAVPRHLGATINSQRARARRRPLPIALSDVVGPAYSSFSRLTHRGDHITVWAKPS